MAIGFMSFGGMLTGDEGNKKPVIEQTQAEAEELIEESQEMVINTNKQ